jgi:ribonuclease E
MLINATQQEELRMAMVDGQRLYDLNIELPAGERKKANIYKGKITRIEPSLEAAFVDYGAERHGFLPLKEISSEYFVKQVDSGKPSIKEVLREGQDIVVQIDKEERGNKGAALTTFVSLAGRFIVLKPNKSRSGGVSRRIVGSDRDLARKSLNEIEVPKDMSVILRTAGIDRSAEELAWDLENLLTIWTAILNVVLERTSPFLIYRESNSVVRALRDYLTTEIGEILIDDEQTFKEAVEFVEQVMPHNLKKLKHYEDPVPLFTRFQIETQIESAFSHSVNLPSGGSVVIDHTEALVSIDINSARATKGGDIEATALNTNLEAAEEIARQLRIRDLGGLIVIDFIDMGPQKHQRDVENRLRESVRQDRARVQIGKISRFGLLEMSRQRLRPSLGESSYLTCPRCSGIGTIRSVESLALAILRIIGEEARKERTAQVIAQLPVEVATFLLNEKRDWVRSLESRSDTRVVLVANPALETPHYNVRRVRDDQTELPENVGASYSLADAAAEPESPQAILERKAIEPAAIAVMKPSTPAPKRKEEKTGFLASLLGFFSGGEEKPAGKKPQQRRRNASGGDSRTRGGQRGRRRPDASRADDNRPARKKRSKKAASKKTASKKTASKKTASKKPVARKQVRQRHEGSDKQAKSPDAAAQQQRNDGHTEERKPSRNRRSRGGRRRRSSADKPTPDNAAEQHQQGKPADQDRPAEKPARKPAPKKDAVTEAKSGEAREAAPAPKPQPAESGPPRVRTDAERAADASARSKKDVPLDQTAPKPSRPKPEPAASSGNGSSEPKAEPKPKSEPRPEAKAEPKPKSAPKPEVKTEPKPQPKPEPKPAAEQEARPAPKPEAKAEPQPKPEGRLLPWDNEGPPTD